MPTRNWPRSPAWCATETERLNNVIQNLLDATRISSEGLRPRFEWAEVSDIVNAALEKRRNRLGERALDVDLAPELPLVYVDPVMVEQALEQLLDNSAKYSPESEPIRVDRPRGRRRGRAERDRSRRRTVAG